MAKPPEAGLKKTPQAQLADLLGDCFPSAELRRILLSYEDLQDLDKKTTYSENKEEYAFRVVERATNLGTDFGVLIAATREERESRAKEFDAITAQLAAAGERTHPDALPAPTPPGANAPPSSALPPEKDASPTTTGALPGPPAALPSPIPDATRQRTPELPDLILTLRITDNGPGQYTLTPEWSVSRGVVTARPLDRGELDRLVRTFGAPPLRDRPRHAPDEATGAALAAWLWGAPGGDDALAVWRERLFLAGFGDRESAHPGPGLRDVRLRLDLPAALADVPWDLLLARGTRPHSPAPAPDLPGWTVERVLAGDRGDVHLRNPTRVVIVARDERTAAAAAGALRESLESVWKSSVHEIVGVHTAEMFDQAVGANTGVLIVATPLDNGRVKLRKPIGFDPRPFPNLLRPEVPPIPLVLLAGPATQPIAPPRGTRALIELLGEDPTTDTRILLREMFVEGVDPVVAATRLNAIHPAAARIHTSFDAWRTPKPVDPVHRFRPRERLDRRLAKGDATELLRVLWAQAERRNAIAVAPGLPGQLVEQFGTQLEAHFKAALTSEHHLVERVDLASAWRGAGPAELQAALEEALDGPVKDRLRALPKDLRGALSEKKPTLLLDWGVFGAGTDRPFSRDLLRTLATFATAPLTQACPGDLRLLHLCTVAAPNERHAAVSNITTTIASDPSFARVFVRPIHAIGLVTQEDLRHFLEEPGNSNFGAGPASPAAPVAAAIWTRAGGVEGATPGDPPQREADFEACCNELVAALDHGWSVLAAEGREILKRREHTRRPDDDDIIA